MVSKHKEKVSQLVLHNRVSSFLVRFHKHQPFGTNTLEECFTSDCSYWFAQILQARFQSEVDCAIMYDPGKRQFATRIGDRIYDFTGDVTKKSTQKWQSWAEYTKNRPAAAANVRADFGIPR